MRWLTLAQSKDLMVSTACGTDTERVQVVIESSLHGGGHELLRWKTVSRVTVRISIVLRLTVVPEDCEEGETSARIMFCLQESQLTLLDEVNMCEDHPSVRGDVIESITASRGISH